MAQKPSLPKGVRDFGPEQMFRRNYLLDTIKGVFKKYGFMPLETPAIENLTTLTGKYGDEGDQLLFKILNSGDFLSKTKKRGHDFYNAIEWFESILNSFLNSFRADQKDNEYIIISDENIASYLNSEEYKNVESFGRGYNNQTLTKKFFKQNLESILRTLQYGFNRRLNPIWENKEKSVKHFISTSFRGPFENDSQQTSVENVNEVESYPPQFENLFDGLYKSSLGSSKGFSFDISEKGLKYDLTVPFARYVVMNQNDITFPFKRYQVQPVWRADRPQKGRYREFYQCDADIIGTNSLVCEAELMAMVNEIFCKLELKDYQVSLSSRKILEGLADVIGATDKFSAFCVILDKLDKIGLEKMLEEMSLLGIPQSGLDRLTAILEIEESNTDKIETLRKVFIGSTVGIEGLNEVETTLKHMTSLGVAHDKTHFDLTLARGLSYYTGIIYEAKPTSVKMGTITAGGRYDNLTGVFGLEGVSGVGISFGVDRIYDVLDELNLFPTNQLGNTKVMITNFDEACLEHALGLSSRLRNNNINCEVYPEPAKMKKQLGYADKKSIPFVVMVGQEEIDTNIYTVKNMESGEQHKQTLLELIDFLAAQ